MELHSDQVIVFDIGNVLVDIDYNQTVKAFERYTSRKISESLGLYKQSPLFDQYERGEISTNGFRNKVSQLFDLKITQVQFDDAWNSLLLAIPNEKIDLLKTLRKRYRIIALSNINELHDKALDKMVLTSFHEKTFRVFFDEVYYSYEMGFRKPEIDIYQKVTDYEGLPNTHFYFVDDKIENVEAARSIGWGADQLNDPSQLVSLLKRRQIL